MPRLIKSPSAVMLLIHTAHISCRDCGLQAGQVSDLLKFFI